MSSLTRVPTQTKRRLALLIACLGMCCAFVSPVSPIQAATLPGNTTSALCSGLSPAIASQMPKAGGGYWQCTLAEEFNGNALNRKLWVPIGLHFGWNFAAAAIFSTEVSGNGGNKGLLDATMSGPALVTGGDFGPEGSLYSVLFCVLVAVVFLLVARRRGNLVPLRRRAAGSTAAVTLAP